MLTSLILISAVLADTPNSNDIPILSMRIRGPALFPDDISIELLCELSWLNFDVVNFGGWARGAPMQALMALCDSVGIYYAISANEIEQYHKEWAEPEFMYWFRNSDESLTSDSAFARWDSELDSIVQYMPAESLYYADTVMSINTSTDKLAEDMEHLNYLWFYEVYDEANSLQGRSMANYQSSFTYDDYIPNVFTQARDNAGIPTMEEVETSGVFSIQKYYAENHEDYPILLATHPNSSCSITIPSGTFIPIPLRFSQSCAMTTGCS